MQNKKQIILSILAIFVLSVLVIGATLAYFQAQGDTTKSVSTIVKTYTTDVFSFETGSALTISLDQESFASGKGNATGSTFAKAILTANNKTNSATEYYYLYLNILENTFNYTQDENTPEILLSITDKDGNAFTSISSLNYKTVTDASGKKISGYDITNKGGLIPLFDNRKITTTSSIEDTWNVTATFINYDADQSANAGKSFEAKLMIQKDKITTLSDYVISQYTGTQGVNGLYYHSSSLSNGAGDNSYRYAGPSDTTNNFVCFGSDASPCSADNLYRIIGVFGDNNHGVTGKQLVKLIKYDYANSILLGTDGDYNSSNKPNASYYKGNLSSIDLYYWNYKNDTTINDGLGSNIWSTSLLNKTNLNKNYLNNIGTTWSNLIEDTTWKLSGHITKFVTPSEMYTAEITNATKTYGPSDGASKIGLMYVSDYGFATSPSAWTTTLDKYDGNDVNGISIRTINWMYMGYYEWTMSPYSSNSSDVFGLYDSGDLYASSSTTSFYGSRPVLYLKASVLFAGGSGTKDSPIILAV